MDKISVVIPNFNGRELLKKNLPTVTHILKNHEIILVDDASTDGSVQYVKKNYPQIKIIEKVVNNGFATSVNLGVKAADGDIVLLLNTDAIPKPNFLATVLTHFGDENVFAVGCLDESHDEDGTVTKRGRGVGSFKRGFLVHKRGEVDKSDTLWVSGGSSVFRKKIWEKLNGFDELFNPFYWEDIDLSYRALKAGFKIVFEPKSVVIHEHSVGSIRVHYSRLKIKSIAYRNQFIFMWKNVTDAHLFFDHFIWLPYHLLIFLLRGDIGFWQGFLGAASKLPEILRQRKTQQKLWRLTDREVIQNIHS